MSFLEILGAVGSVASIIGLIIGGTIAFNLNKFINKDNSRKKNSQIMFGGSGNQQANGDIKEKDGDAVDVEK